MLFQEKGGRVLALVADSNEVLIGTIFSENRVEGAWSSNRGFVTVAEDYIKHDIYIMKIVRRFDRPLVKKFGEKYSKLRDIFKDEEDDMKIYIDGKFHDRGEARISVFDHGLLYGDGVFEGIRIYNRKVFKLTEHIDRLYHSAKAILLDIPMQQTEMEQAVLETVIINAKSMGISALL